MSCVAYCRGNCSAKYTSWRISGDKPLNTRLPKSAHPWNALAVCRAAEQLKLTNASSLHSSNTLSSSLPLPQLVESEREQYSCDEEDELTDGDAEEDIKMLKFSSSVLPYASLKRSVSAPTPRVSPPPPARAAPSLSNRQMKELFPFCLVFDQTMTIVDCGDGLVEVLCCSPVGLSLAELLEIHMPAGDIDTWANFLQLYCLSNTLTSEIRSDDNMHLSLKGLLSLSDDCQTGYYMCHANVHSLEEMKQSRLCPRHLAAQVCHMDYLLQAEHLGFELRASKKLLHVQKELDVQTALSAKLTRDSVRQATKHAAQSLENKRTFVRYIGHEIRTPLTVVKLGLKLALKDIRNLGASEDVITNISDCEDSVDVAVAILNDLLAYEKLDSGILEMFKEIIVVVPFILRSLRPFEKEAKMKNIALTIDNNCERDMHALAFYGDKSKMSQVIRNFISNSLKFTPENGKVNVRISLLKPEKRRRAQSHESSRSHLAQQALALSPGKARAASLSMGTSAL
jgi:hypothetical protein